MKMIPETENPVVIRTDFANQEGWEEVCSRISEPSELFLASVEFIDDRTFENLTPDELRKRVPADYQHAFIMIVDETAVKSAEHPLLVLDLLEGRELRAVATEIAAIENNLTIANMGFEEFAEAVDDDGIFRGFEAGGIG